MNPSQVQYVEAKLLILYHFPQTKISQGMYPSGEIIIDSVKIFPANDEMMEWIRTLPRGGMYWKIHSPRTKKFPKGGDFAPFGPWDFPRANVHPLWPGKRAEREIFAQQFWVKLVGPIDLEPWHVTMTCEVSLRNRVAQCTPFLWFQWAKEPTNSPVKIGLRLSVLSYLYPIKVVITRPP